MQNLDLLLRNFWGSEKMCRAEDYITICGWGLYIPADEFKKKCSGVTVCPGVNIHENVTIYGVRSHVFICDGVFRIDSRSQTTAVIDPDEPAEDLLEFGRKHFPTTRPQLMMISVRHG